MTLLQQLNLRYLNQMFRTPEGRAHVLAQAADGEASGESAIFDRLLAKVDDPELQRVISRHREDELRHEKLFRARLAAQNARWELPEELRLVQRIDHEAGGVMGQPIRTHQDVLAAYSFLQALEERAVYSFGLFIEALQKPDPESAAVFAEVLEDEKRHLKYCAAVAKRYAASEEERLQTLQRMRAAEARAFKANQLANMNFTLARGWVGGPVQTALWRVVRALAFLVPPAPRSAHAPTLQSAAAA
jgi:rubrerythrin